MDSDVQDLALAQGIKDSLEEAGFDTVDSILKEAPLRKKLNDCKMR
jgi:hypothetical protein